MKHDWVDATLEVYARVGFVPTTEEEISQLSARDQLALATRDRKLAEQREESQTKALDETFGEITYVKPKDKFFNRLTDEEFLSEDFIVNGSCKPDNERSRNLLAMFSKLNKIETKLDNGIDVSFIVSSLKRELASFSRVENFDDFLSRIDPDSQWRRDDDFSMLDMSKIVKTMSDNGALDVSLILPKSSSFDRDVVVSGVAAEESMITEKDSHYADPERLGQKKITTPKFNRKSLENLLGLDASYLRVRSDSKHPCGAYSAGKMNRLKHVPKDGNFGVIPQGRLFVLDLDVTSSGSYNVEKPEPTKSELELQVDFFSRFFGADLNNTFKVKTSSGGIHLYLRLPESFNLEQDGSDVLPKASLRNYSEDFSSVMGEKITLDADIRTGAINGYVVAPFSVLPDGAYEVTGTETSILTISEDSVERLRQVVSSHKSRVSSAKKSLREGVASRVKTKASDKAFDDFELNADQSTDDALCFENVDKLTKLYASPDDTRIHEIPSVEIINEISKELTKLGKKTYHAKRAFVKSALHCCYDDFSVALACSALRIDRDTYRDSKIKLREVMIDLKGFNPPVRFHGKYCEKGRKHLRNITKAENKDVSNGKTLEENLRGLQEKIKNSDVARYKADRRAVNARVIDPVLVHKALFGKAKKPSQQYLDAMSIFDCFIQPLSNSGARRILLTHSALSAYIELNPSRAKQALRILREKGVIQVEQRQRPGVAPTYSVPDSFTHKTLTRVLRYSWSKVGKVSEEGVTPLYFDRLTGDFVKVFKNEVVSDPHGYMGSRRYIQDGNIVAPGDFVGPGAALSYLQEEQKKLGYKATDSGVIIETTGELISPAKKIEVENKVRIDLDDSKLNKTDEKPALCSGDVVFRKFNEVHLKKRTTTTPGVTTSSAHPSHSESFTQKKGSRSNRDLGVVLSGTTSASSSSANHQGHSSLFYNNITYSRESGSSDDDPV